MADVAKCMVIPEIVSAIKDRKLRFRFCELTSIYTSETMKEKFSDDRERLNASIRILNDSLKAKETVEDQDTFEVTGNLIPPETGKDAWQMQDVTIHGLKDHFDKLKQEAKEYVLSEAVPSNLLKTLIGKAFEEASIPRIDAFGVRLRDALKDIEDLSNGIRELKSLITGKELKFRETSGQQGIILVPEKEHKKPKIDVKTMGLTTFATKSWGKKEK